MQGKTGGPFPAFEFAEGRAAKPGSAQLGQRNHLATHVGIDLGTTFSPIARVDADMASRPHFPDPHEAERFETPSVVHIGSDPPALVGQAESRNCWKMHPSCLCRGSPS